MAIPGWAPGLYIPGLRGTGEAERTVPLHLPDAAARWAAIVKPESSPHHISQSGAQMFALHTFGALYLEHDGRPATAKPQSFYIAGRSCSDSICRIPLSSKNGHQPKQHHVPVTLLPHSNPLRPRRRQTATRRRRSNGGTG